VWQELRRRCVWQELLLCVAGAATSNVPDCATSKLQTPNPKPQTWRRMDLTRELLLGVCKGGLRLVKLGLYDPGREEEIAFFSYSEIYEWGCCDIQTFEFCAASGLFYSYLNP
jgi:hypothetical protein